MISNILINAVASYKSLVRINDLKKVNYFFGENGAGKTTISRLIANPDNYQNCSIDWLGSQRLSTLVYNRDFIDNNFSQNQSVKGVFTLGEDQVHTENKIAELHTQIEKHNKKISSLQTQLSGDENIEGKNTELTHLKPQLVIKCWAQKQKLDDYFYSAFTGLRSSRERFCDRVLSEWKSNTAELLDLDALKEKAKTVFGESPERISLIPLIPVIDFSTIENNALLIKIIVGDQDIEIAKLIDHLGNSDWIKQGLNYYSSDSNKCPFCQQDTPETLHQEFQSFFSKAYEQDIQGIKRLQQDYESKSVSLINELINISDLSKDYIEKSVFDTKIEIIEGILKQNKQELSKKISEPSSKISLLSVTEEISELSEWLIIANDKIKQHNAVIDNIDNERKDLTDKVWKYVVTELRVGLEDYESKKGKLEKMIQGMEGGLNKEKARIRTLENEIAELEKTISSIKPTKIAMNELLNKFGFTSFYIDIAEDGKHYKICREDGRDARQTLSEGEKTFITFLYFYHLIKGAYSSSGITENKVIVFDDPISSLDSNILYIVSTLIKEIVKETDNIESTIKQVFVLTHNVYFHKEVTFSQKREKGKVLNSESFWMVSKGNDGTVVSGCDQNPIQSAYELLWQDVKSPTASNISLQNTLRRILENYFTMWGGMGKDEICALFEGRDKLICNSLFSWVNDGSHSINDDLYINHGNQTNETYLAVFAKIFEKANQQGHYNMMMGA